MKNISNLIACFLILFCVNLSFAQRGYLKMGSIKGESAESAHKGWIDIDSFNQGIMPKQNMSGMARGQSPVVFENLVITKKLDRSSPLLMEMCAKGQVVPELVLEIMSNDRTIHYRMTLKNVQIKSMNTSAICDNDCKISDEVAFSYSEIKWEYWNSDNSKTEASFNLKTGK
jgi:type VI secretion system secreted protein Hcp